MRIGIFTDTYTPHINGVTTSVVMLKRALEEKGHTVYIVTVNPQNFQYQYEENSKVIRIPGVPIGIYDYRLTGIYPLKVIKKIKRWNLDVIHSQTEFGIGTFARIIAKQLNIPLVHTYHTMYEDYVHYITHGYFKRSSKKIVEYLTLFYCDKTISELIVPTKKAYELFKDKYKVDRNVYIVPTGIETDRFQAKNNKKFNLEAKRKQYNLSKEDFVILFVGRIAEEKNIPLLISSMNKLTEKHKQIKLLIVGDGPDLEKYKLQVIKNKLEQSIIFTGKVPWDQIPEYYLMSNIFATASTTETQGLTVIEAMSASLPVVCIKDESFQDTVIDNLNGLVFKNKREFQKAILKLYENPDLTEQLKKQAQITANTYSSKYFAERILDVYQIAIKNNPKSPIPIIDKLKRIINKSE